MQPMLLIGFVQENKQWGFSKTDEYNRTVYYPISVNTPLNFSVTLIRHDTQQNYWGIQSSGYIDQGACTPKVYSTYAQLWNEHNSGVYWILIAK